MHQRISTTLKTLRQDLATGLGGDFIVKACRAAGHTWSDSCLLTPAAIIHWFLVQIFHGNTALHHVSLLAGRAFTASAFCQGTCRTPAGRLSGGPPRNGQGPDSCHREGGTPGRGHRTFLEDGSAFSMPDTPELQAHFGQPGGQAKGCGFPIAHIPSSLFHAGTRAPPGGHRGAVAVSMTWPASSESFLCSWPATSWWPTAASARSSIWRLLMAKEAHAVFRLHQKQIVDFTPGRAHARSRAKRECPRGCAQPLGVGLRVDGSSGRILQAGAASQVDERRRI